MKTRNTAEWVEAFESAAVPCGPINTIDQVFENPQVLARGMQMSLERQDGLTIPSVANPIVFSESPNEYNKPSPTLGHDTDSVLRHILGLDQDEILRLKQRRVIV